MFTKKIKKDNFSRYEDPTGEFTNRQLKLANWYISHKLLLQKIGFGLLITWCIATVGYSFSYWGYYLAIGYWQDQDMLIRQTIEFENYDKLKVFYGHQDLIIKKVDVYQSVSAEKYDLIVDIFNPNERWLVGLIYKFVYHGGETPLVRTVILPGEKRPLAYLGLDSKNYPDGAKLIIEEIIWRGVAPHVIKDAGSYMDEHLDFEISNFKFTRASRVTGIPSHMIEFDIRNATAYNYWEPAFYVELYDQGRVGMLYATVKKFNSGETHHIDARSFINNLRVESIKVYPLLNVFDRNEFMKEGIYVD